jgi:hypothetical protein
MWRSRVFITLIGPGVLLAALAAGCASTEAVTTPAAPVQTTPGAVGGGYAYQHAAGTTCPAASTDLAIGQLRKITAETALPKDFHAVAVVRCMTDEQAVPGDGTWQFAIAQRASGNLTSLLALLRRPDQSPSPNVACAAELLLVPAFGLVGSDGTVIRPRLPVTECGVPLPDVLTALSDQPWKTETETKLTRIQTQLEATTGCESAYKYLPGLKYSPPPIPWSQVRHPLLAPITLVCVYQVDHSNSTPAEGTFVTGTNLTAQRAPGIQQAVDSGSMSASAAPACSVNAARFAMLGTRDEQPYLVELDGCHRLMFPNGYLAAAPAALLDLLAQSGIK